MLGSLNSQCSRVAGHIDGTGDGDLHLAPWTSRVALGQCFIPCQQFRDAMETAERMGCRPPASLSIRIDLLLCFKY